jgi:hypothetical protein
MIKGNRNFYSKEELHEELYIRMNARSRKTLGLNTWEHKDSVETLDQLIKGGKVRVDKFLWRKKLYAYKKGASSNP